MRLSPLLSLRVRSYVSHPRFDPIAPDAPIQKPIEAAYYRGGTSRAVIIQPHNLPRDRAKWPSIFRQIMGSGDPYGRQLDGMGAGISSLSKICLVEPYGKRVPSLNKSLRFRAGFGGIDAAREGRQATQAQEQAQMSEDGQPLDIDYTFVGLGIEQNEVDVAGNCGNMSSAIGPYAYNAGLLEPHIYGEGDGSVSIMIRNTNTGKIIESTFEVVGGQAATKGDYTIDGVTGKGSKVKLDFQKPYGSKTGKVLPTGQRVDKILGYRVSCIDGANPAVFIRADDVGVEGTILPNGFTKLSDKLALLERIRKAAAVAMGIAATEDSVPRTVPKIGLVSGSSTHSVLSGQKLRTSQMDVVIRFLSDTQPHRAIPLTAALTTAVAARIPGTVVEQMLAPEPVSKGALTIGHASGRLQVNAVMDRNNKIIPKTATVYRTAKRLFEGNVFWVDKQEADLEPNDHYSSSGRHSRGLAFVLEHRGQSSSHLFEDEDWEEEEPQPKEESRKEARQKVEEAAPTPQPSLSYRPLGDIQAATTPLTKAIQDLQAHLSHILEDRRLSKRSYAGDLLATITDSHNKIKEDIHPTTKRLHVSNAMKMEMRQNRKMAGKQEDIHPTTKPLRMSNAMKMEMRQNRKMAEKQAKIEAREAKGWPRTTRAEVGLTKSGYLVKSARVSNEWDGAGGWGRE